MPRFRKLPVEIEAHQWFKNGDHPEDGEGTFIDPETKEEHRCEGKVVRRFRRPDVNGDVKCSECGRRFHDHGWIDTKEDGHRVCPSDWIIKGVKGEFYPCKDNIFRATYEPVDDEAQEAWDEHAPTEPT